MHSLSLPYCLLILSISDHGMFTQRLNLTHTLSSMMSSTVERFSGVRLGSGNTQRETEMRERCSALHLRNIALVIIGHSCGHYRHARTLHVHTHARTASFPGLLPPLCAIKLRACALRTEEGEGLGTRLCTHTRTHAHTRIHTLM